MAGGAPSPVGHGRGAAWIRHGASDVRLPFDPGGRKERRRARAIESAPSRGPLTRRSAEPCSRHGSDAGRRNGRGLFRPFFVIHLTHLSAVRARCAKFMAIAAVAGNPTLSEASNRIAYLLRNVDWTEDGTGVISPRPLRVGGRWVRIEDFSR